MPQAGPFPTKDAELNTYFQRVVAYLNVHRLRFRISDVNLNLMNYLYGFGTPLSPIAGTIAPLGNNTIIVTPLQPLMRMLIENISPQGAKPDMKVCTTDSGSCSAGSILHVFEPEELTIAELGGEHAALVFTNENIAEAVKYTVSFPAQQWTTLYPLAKNPDTGTTALKRTKTANGKQLKTLLETIYADIPKSVLTQDDRTTLNLKLRDTTPTKIQPVSYPPTASFAQVSKGIQILRFANPTDPQSKKMPKGNKIEIQIFIGAKGLSGNQLKFTTYHIQGKFLQKVTFTDDDEGQTAYYRCCYVTNRGDRGPFSAVSKSVIL